MYDPFKEGKIFREKFRIMPSKRECGCKSRNPGVFFPEAPANLCFVILNEVKDLEAVANTRFFALSRITRHQYPVFCRGF
jgi:hypothetical protein